MRVSASVGTAILAFALAIPSVGCSRTRGKSPTAEAASPPSAPQPAAPGPTVVPITRPADPPRRATDPPALAGGLPPIEIDRPPATRPTVLPDLPMSRPADTRPPSVIPVELGKSRDPVKEPVLVRVPDLDPAPGAVEPRPEVRPETRPMDPPPRASTGSIPSPKYPSEVGGKSLEEWIKLLPHPDPSKRALAVMAIPKFGPTSSRAVPDLLKRCTGDPDISPRIKAVIVLRAVEVHKSQIPGVVKTLSRILSPQFESQIAVRYEAACTLKRFVNDAQDAIPTLARACHDSGSWEIRQVCVALLWRAAAVSKEGKDKVTACKTLVEILSAPTYNHDVVREAIRGLGNLGKPGDAQLHERVIRALRRWTRAENKALAVWAYSTLVGVEGPKNEHFYLSKLTPFLTNKDLDVRCQAAQALGAHGTKAKKFVPRLVEMLGDHQAIAVDGACQALAQIKDSSDEVINPLLGLLDQDAERAYPACAALVGLKANKPKVLEALEKQLDRKDLEDRLRPVIKYTIEELKKPVEKPKNPVK
jgi:HEAT repeat protein